MNKTRTIPTSLAFLALVLAVMRPCALQAEKIDTEHKVLFPTGDASWTVSLQAEKPSGPPAAKSDRTPEILKIDIVSRGPVRRDVIHWSEGANGESWWIKNPPVTLLRNKPGEPVRLMKSGYLDSRRFDDSSFSWVNAQTYKGDEDYGGKKVRRYKQHRKAVEREEGEAAEPQTALIDAESGRPVLWSDGKVIATFSFDPATPAGPLTMPEDFREALKNYLAYISPPRKLGKK